MMDDLLKAGATLTATAGIVYVGSYLASNAGRHALDAQGQNSADTEYTLSILQKTAGSITVVAGIFVVGRGAQLTLESECTAKCVLPSRAGTLTDDITQKTRHMLRPALTGVAQAISDYSTGARPATGDVAGTLDAVVPTPCGNINLHVDLMPENVVDSGLQGAIGSLTVARDALLSSDSVVEAAEKILTPTSTTSTLTLETAIGDLSATSNTDWTKGFIQKATQEVARFWMIGQIDAGANAIAEVGEIAAIIGAHVAPAMLIPRDKNADNREDAARKAPAQRAALNIAR